MTSAVLLEVRRGPLVEEIHRGHLAVVDHTGALLASVGDPANARTYWRSAAKPLQTMPLVYTGAAERFGFDAQDLAICSASHSGQPFHVAQVERVLAKAGCSVADLACGTHPPLDAESAASLQRAGTPPNALHNNCSGKHAGMLALARHLGADLKGYREPGHPVQREILTNVMRFTGCGVDEIVIGVDGCGVPTFGLTVERMAFTYARLMRSDLPEGSRPRAAVSVREAMIAHPQLVAGTGRLDTDLMRVGAGRILSKGGASGVVCVGVAGGVGVAAKLESGPRLAGFGAQIVIEALRQIGALGTARVEALGAHARPQLLNVSGARVGEIRTVFELSVARASS